MSLPSLDRLAVAASDDGAIVSLEFDHGKANEMGSAALRDLEALTRYLGAAGGKARALITFSRRRSSKGTPIFVAGADVTERVGWTDPETKAHVAWQRGVLAALRRAPVLHVVVVEGIALGWGTEYLLTADWRIGCDRAVFGLPETGLGIVPGAGGTSDLWAEIGVGHALRLGMTGERIDADEALRIGLIHERVEDVDAGIARGRRMAEAVIRRSPTAVAAFKEGVLDAVGAAAADRAALEARAYARCVDHGEAAIGRRHFKEILAGDIPPWGTLHSGD